MPWPKDRTRLVAVVALYVFSPRERQRAAAIASNARAAYHRGAPSHPDHSRHVTCIPSAAISRGGLNIISHTYTAQYAAVLGAKANRIANEIGAGEPALAPRRPWVLTKSSRDQKVAPTTNANTKATA